MSWLDELRLVAITDLDAFTPAQIVERWERLASAARPWSVAIDLRAPQQPARPVLELGRELKRIALNHEQRLLVNERLDLARLLAADGVHLREDSIATADARAYLSSYTHAACVFRACHRGEDAPSLDADAIFLSPILQPRKGNSPLGVAALQQARTLLQWNAKATRVFALGGVDAEGARACLAAGADGVAAIGAALGAESPLPLLSALDIGRAALV